MTPDRLRAAVAQCWTTQLLLVFGLLVLALVDAAIRDDFVVFLYDPGTPGWRFFCVAVPLYAAMPMLVRLSERRWFRWLNTVLLGLTALLPIAHQAKHLSQGKPLDVSVTGDVTMLLMALLGVAVAQQWARSGGDER